MFFLEIIWYVMFLKSALFYLSIVELNVDVYKKTVELYFHTVQS